jgi:hypothetical protein
VRGGKKTQLYAKRDYFNFPIVNFPFILSNIPAAPAYVCMVARFTTTYAISAHHHSNCEFEPRSWLGVLDTTLCEKVCQ